MTKKDPQLRDIERALPIALLKAREKVMTRFRPMLASHGLTEQQWRVLRVLFEVRQMEAGELAIAASILAPSLTRILKALEHEGYLERHRDKQDARRSLVILTPKGEALVQKIAPESRTIYEQIETEIGAEKITELLRLLAEINAD